MNNSGQNYGLSSSGQNYRRSNVKKILVVISIIVILLIIIYIIKKLIKSNKLSSLTSAKTSQKIDASSLATNSSSGVTTNYTYSTWFYIDDWNYRYGETKVILGRANINTDKTKASPSPSIVLGAMQNNVTISQTCYLGNSENSSGGEIVHSCSINNVPIQKWTNLLVSVYNRTLDIYLNGKLVRTCMLPGVAKIDSTQPVYITPLGGFSGWTSYIKYWPNATNPQEAWNIYKKGYGVSFLGSIFGKYSVKLTVSGGSEDETYSL